MYNRETKECTIIDFGISIQSGVGKYSPEKIQRINTLLGTSNTKQIDNWLELMNNKEKFDELMGELYNL